MLSDRDVEAVLRKVKYQVSASGLNRRLQDHVPEQHWILARSVGRQDGILFCSGGNRQAKSSQETARVQMDYARSTRPVVTPDSKYLKIGCRTKNLIRRIRGKNGQAFRKKPKRREALVIIHVFVFFGIFDSVRKCPR